MPDEPEKQPADGQGQSEPGPQPGQEGEKAPDPGDKSRMKILDPRAPGGVRPAYPFEEENEQHRQHVAKGKCPHKCPVHGKPCQKTDGHAPGHVCDDCGPLLP